MSDEYSESDSDSIDVFVPKPVNQQTAAEKLVEFNMACDEGMFDMGEDDVDIYGDEEDDEPEVVEMQGIDTRLQADAPTNLYLQWKMDKSLKQYYNDMDEDMEVVHKVTCHLELNWNDAATNENIMLVDKNLGTGFALKYISEDHEDEPVTGSAAFIKQ